MTGRSWVWVTARGAEEVLLHGQLSVLLFQYPFHPCFTAVAMKKSLSFCQKHWQQVTAQWLERRTRDWKVPGSNPCRSGGRIFFSRVDFLCWLWFRYPFHPRVTAVARKRSRSFCQKRRWQVTAKHAYTLCMWLCMKWRVVWCTQNLRRDGCSFMWHQPCQRCKYTTSVDIQKTRYKKLVTHVEPHASAVSLLKRAENSAI